MSATQTKGCPFPEEKGDHEVVDGSDETYSLSLIIYICVNFQSFPLVPRRHLLLSIVTKVSKNTLFPGKAEKSKNYRFSL